MGRDHENVLALVTELGQLLILQGKHDETEKMHRRALEGRERTLEVDHADTLLSCSQLGIFLCQQGKLDEAEKLIRRSLE